METIFYFEEDLTGFLGKGGWISPGIVPSSEKVLGISLDDILKLWKTFIEHMNKINILAKNTEWLITTSCGLGSLQTSETQRAMELLKEFSENL